MQLVRIVLWKNCMCGKRAIVQRGKSGKVNVKEQKECHRGYEDMKNPISYHTL